MTSSRTLQQMQEETVEVEKLLGWKGPDVPLNSFGDSMALLHSEVSEAFEAYRDHGLADVTDPDLTLEKRTDYREDSMGNFVSRLRMMPSKPEGVGSEFADILIRLLSSCDQYKIDLEYEYERKMAFNRTREHRHGGKHL